MSLNFKQQKAILIMIKQVSERVKEEA
jgi:hypothetical protein